MRAPNETRAAGVFLEYDGNSGSRQLHMRSSSSSDTFISRRASALALLVLVGFGAAACSGSGEAAPGQAAQVAGPQRGGGGFGAPRGGNGDRIVPVEVAPVTLGTIARAVTVSGVVEPIRTVGVNAQLAGAILAIAAEEGVAVRQGAVLARVDDRELAAQLASAEAGYRVAEANYERAERLRERQVITAAEYDRERAAHAAARAQLDQLRTRIGFATVRAPITGIVTEKRVEAGDVVGSQARLFTIADMSTLVVRVGVSELDVVELSPGDPVSVLLDAFPDRQLQGAIRRIFPTADPTTRLVSVEVALSGESARTARSGFLARVTFQLNPRQDARLLPSSAIVRGAGSEAVFVVENGTALRRSVETGLNWEGRVEITAGLEPGEVVIIRGNNQLRDGAAIRVVEGAAGSAGS
jgi:membrane fusion protein, multidrug efflux system